MALDVRCPECDEADDLVGQVVGDRIELTCAVCECTWTRDPAPRCQLCGGDDMYPAIAAIVEKGRGTQLSVVGTRIEHLCESCDAETLARYFRNRPNPLMPDDLPNAFG